MGLIHSIKCCLQLLIIKISPTVHPTTVIWSAAILWQFLVHANDHGWFKKIPRASVESLGPKAFRISISMPNKRTWGAGSYVYLRFLSIRPWESHPFTISSLPGTSVQEEHEESGQSGINQMVFLIRPQTGLTERLHNLLMASQGQLMCSCLVDGPYDGFMNKLRACDSVVLLAGGRGMVAIIPVAQALQRASGEIGISCCKNIKVVWSFKELSALNFFKFQLDEVKGFVSAYNTGNADLKTGFTTESFNYENDVSQQCLTPEDCFDKLERGRPNIQLIIGHAAKKFSGRLGILVCGPESMVWDTRNVVAGVQKQIFMSDKSIQSNEIEFYEESYTLSPQIK